jgi:hypothetical protein
MCNVIFISHRKLIMSKIMSKIMDAKVAELLQQFEGQQATMTVDKRENLITFYNVPSDMRDAYTATLRPIPQVRFNCVQATCYFDIQQSDSLLLPEILEKLLTVKKYCAYIADLLNQLRDLQPTTKNIQGEYRQLTLNGLSEADVAKYGRAIRVGGFACVKDVAAGTVKTLVYSEDFLAVIGVITAEKLSIYLEDEDQHVVVLTLNIPEKQQNRILQKLFAIPSVHLQAQEITKTDDMLILQITTITSDVPEVLQLRTW